MNPVRQSKAEWETEYRSGAWEFLNGDGEYCHYTVIAGLVQKRPAPISLLDIGCGEGVVLRYLDLSLVSKYTGVDLAQSALERITPRRQQDRYICSTLENFVPDEKWDVILFSEVLYYTSRPVAELGRFERCLHPGGTFVISMFKKPSPLAYNNRCIRSIRKYFKRASYSILDAVEVKRLQTSTAWQVFSVRPPGI